jgi:SAM-dependent methyltransferase
LLWEELPLSIRSSFCCVNCENASLELVDSALICTICGSRFDFVHGGQVPSFSPQIYDSPQAKTRRIRKGSSIANSPVVARAKQVLDKRMRWPMHRLLMRSEIYWERQLSQFREIEQWVMLDLLQQKADLEKVNLLVEFGIGSMDRREFYHRISRYAVCSDIYLDSSALQAYLLSDRILYCIINGEHIPFCEGSVDLVVTSHVVEHFPDRNTSLRKIWHILKPNGLACHVVPTIWVHLVRHLTALVTNPLTLTPRLTGGIHGEYDSVLEELTTTTVTAWKHIFKNNGFNIIGNAPGVFVARPLPAWLSTRIGQVCHIYGSHIFLMRKSRGKDS